MKEKFGEYLKQKRIEKGITSRQLARELEISVSYISELEAGKKLPPNSKDEKYNNLIDKISNYLKLSTEEYFQMKELADVDLVTKGYVSNDISEYVNSVPLAITALRKAKDANFSESEWDKIIKIIEKNSK